jgi:hypothetical protein
MISGSAQRYFAPRRGPAHLESKLFKQALKPSARPSPKPIAALGAHRFASAAEILPSAMDKSAAQWLIAPC